MPKTKKTKQNFTKMLYVVIVALFAAAVMLTTALYSATRKGGPASQRAVNVGLGAMEYSITEDKATKRDDASINNLRNFLERAAQKDIELGCDTAYYNVVRFTKQETQVLLSYGCEHPGASMFAVKTGYEWELISPTNQFDDLGIPSCDHTKIYGISAEIAPVCVNGLSASGGQLRYEVR